MIKILENHALSEELFLLTTDISKPSSPGQFYMLNSMDHAKLLGRPISVFNYEADETQFLIAKVGKGTEDLAKLKAGDFIRGSGPYGNGFPEPNGEKIALIGGGTGIAVFYHMAKHWADKAEFQLYIGLREPSDLDKYFNDLDVPVKLKHGGFITDIVDYHEPDAFYTCGPRPMMDKVLENAKDKPVYMSLERRMACGFGACLGCTIHTREGLKKVCKDGPVFSGELLR